jgi:outer membrane protein TolC
LDDPALITSRQSLIDMIDDRRSFVTFSNFMVEEGLAASPELREIQAGIDAQQRTLKSTKAAFWQPSLSLGAEQTEIFNRSGASSSGPIIDAIGDSETIIALQLRLPLYTGGSRRADETQAAEELTGLRLQRQATIERVEQRTRSALQTARASYANIELLRQAADAALKNLELVQDSYARGVVSIVDLLDAQNSAVVSEQRASNAIYNFLKDLMELERSISRFDFFQSADEQAQWIKRLQAFFKQRSVFEQ